MISSNLRSASVFSLFMNDKRISLPVSILFASIIVGCGPNGRVVRNPIVAGDPLLTAELPPKSDTVRDAKSLWISAATCEHWPIEDVVRVRVTDAQVCVQTLRSEAAKAGAPFPTDATAPESIALFSGDATPRSLALASDAPPVKISVCHRPDGAAMDVWKVARVGCTANDGFITDATRKLSVNAGQPDEIRWIFEETPTDRFSR